MNSFSMHLEGLGVVQYSVANGCQYKWPQSFETVAIAPKELVPIVLASVVCGRARKGQSIQVDSYDETVVSYSKNPSLMHFICCLFFVLAIWDIAMHASHIPGLLNVVANAISHNNLTLLFEMVLDVSCSCNNCSLTN